ncbi:Remorin family protein [Striga hermonthica]|uniref:Remorin family protein n=1 Tax=Striga hermonthica TaxID=68872 RepID=A0A9N7P149_STRHE|nr:Remorin family protein [Striga hermonthica]
MPSATETTTGKNPSIGRPTSILPEDHRLNPASTGLGSSEAKAYAWEKGQIEKIRKRYEKMQSEIIAWENEKKLTEKHEMERKKEELEQRKSTNLKHYYNKIARIDHIARGAKAQLEEKRKHEEFIVKEKARKIRSTGKTPFNCFCF